MSDDVFCFFWFIFCLLATVAVVAFMITTLGEWLFIDPLDEIHFKLDFIIDQLTK